MDGVTSYMTFKPGNNLRYWQDFWWHSDIPHGVRFAVRKLRPGVYTLTGPGYGETGNYGNGRIFIYRK